MIRDRTKSRLFQQFSRVGRAVASPARLEILETLAQGRRSVEAIAAVIRQSVANTSHHLQVLRDARLVDGRKDGLRVFYELADPEVFTLIRCIRTVAERRYDEIERLVKTYYSARDQLQPVSREELLARANQGTVVVLDVRPSLEYAAGHIPGAVSVPLEQLETRMAELPADRVVVAYCRGPYCLLAFKAVELLRARGRNARRLVEGFPEWRAAGLPVTASPGEST